MDKIVDYRIFTSPSYADLSRIIREHIPVGWVPVGSHQSFISTDSDGNFLWAEYSQTAVKYQDIRPGR